MIEMLGVLVIIGVLSVAALFGFTYAMNKHRANETIHDVMLRASNVPMIDEYYQTRPTGYAFKFPDLQDELSSMGYTLNTVKNSEYGYVYKVEAEAIPYRVCNMILRLEPTDIDEIRIGADKAVYKRGLWDLCETHVNEATDTVLMSFYFEKVCKTNADCSTCQECYQGRCKANYNLVGCETEGSDVPSSCIGSDCDENGGCVGSDCTICVGKDCDGDGNCTGPDCTSCTGSDCGSNGECEGPDCEGCQGEGCTLNPPGSGDDPCDKDPDSYECQTKCQDSPNPYCCRYPEAEECKCSSNRPICSSCERYTYDVKGCAIGCESACNTLNCESCVGGLCVSSCSGDEYCENGVCKKECVPGCDAGQCMKCEDGSCVSSCSGDEYCDNGVCKKGCDPVCDSSQCMKCEDGTCVSSCSGDEYCDNGVCKKGCDPACDATQCMKCEDGSCVTSCGDTEECVNGSCVAQCGPCEERIEGECQSICDGGQVCENEQCVCPVEMPNWYGEMCHLCPEYFSECEGNCCSPDETCCQGACYDFTLCAGSSTGGFDYSTCSCICSSTQQICSLTDEKWCCSREEECSNAEVGACCEKLTPEDCSVCSKLELRGGLLSMCIDGGEWRCLYE